MTQSIWKLVNTHTGEVLQENLTEEEANLALRRNNGSQHNIAAVPQHYKFQDFGVQGKVWR